MPDPVVIECPGTCTVTVVHDLALPPLQLTLEEGGQVAAAILFVWAAAYAIRMAVRALHVDHKEGDDKSD